MRWPRLFRRRARGRHVLGAAVTDLPSAPAARPAPPAAPALPAGTPPAAPERVAVREPGPTPPLPTGPRVALGFRDGSSAELDPTSEHFLALEALAAELTAAD